MMLLGTSGGSRQHCLSLQSRGHSHADSFCSFTGLGSKQPLFSLEACQGILALLDVSFQVCGWMHSAVGELWPGARLPGVETQP